VISAIYGLRAAARVFFGPQSTAFAQVAAANPPSDIGWGEKLPALVLIATLLFVGIWPKSFSAAINRALTNTPAAMVASR
jgi:NADH-quinone oxidoreductase subunit M